MLLLYWVIILWESAAFLMSVDCQRILDQHGSLSQYPEHRIINVGSNFSLTCESNKANVTWNLPNKDHEFFYSQKVFILIL